jgi:hypothetical protein
MKYEFSRQILEKYSNIKFHENPILMCDMKILPMEVESFHADGQTYRHDELIVAFLNSANATENLQLILCKGKGKAVPLQAWRGPVGSRKLRFPDHMTTGRLYPKEIHLVLISVRG